MLLILDNMKKTINRYKPLTLPSDNDELYKFLQSNKLYIMESITNSIEYAVGKNLPLAEVFSFKNLDFIVTLPSESFEENINHIYDYYIKNEKYELCGRVVRLKEKLKNNEQKKKDKKRTTGIFEFTNN